MKDLQETYTHSLRESETPGILFEILGNVFPLLHQQLEPAVWEKLVRDFFHTHPIKTPFSHEIPDDFVEYLYTHAEKNWFELAHYDWVELALGIDMADLSHIKSEGNIPLVSPLAYLLHYETLNNSYYIAFRNRTHEVFYHPINLFSAKFFELLKNNTTLTGEAVLEKLALETQHPNPELMKKDGLALLQEWREKDILLF
ncbi:MAG TPA: putative DNA-binding domain-containing protein [Gammaproteobacteria bacterium]|nr:putative DNA-binding domain-containing protein [Gammaproteobacteria bacterium]